ncbi:MAG: hypothetical protein RIR43_322 [Pseudomonadota bacterium]|jgi:peptide-methionine (R)-S-oxide reductase
MPEVRELGCGLAYTEAVSNPHRPGARPTSLMPDSDDPRYPVRKSDAQWRESLGTIEYQVTRQAATERAFTGRFWDHWEGGHYDCVCCGARLFNSRAKFDAGCGWPSYWEPVDGEVIEELPDHSHGMVRIEVRCRRCGAHLGHVFDDGPRPTGLRYCINSASLAFRPQAPEDGAGDAA